MNAVMQSLTVPEAARFSRAESVIERGKSAFVEVGLALTEIRDGRLYRESHGTFEEYCQKRWGFTRRYADSIIAASVVVKEIENHGSQGPASERQARPLSKLKPIDQPKAWRAATERAVAERRPVTAKDVEVEVGKISQSGRADWELNKIPAPKETDPEDQDSDGLFHLKRSWRKANKRERTAFLQWVKKQKS